MVLGVYRHNQDRHVPPLLRIVEKSVDLPYGCDVALKMLKMKWIMGL